MKPQKIIVYIKFKIWQKTLGTGRQKNRVININLILYILYFCLFRLQAQSLPGISDIYYSQQAHDLPAYAPFVGSCLVEALFRNDYCARELMYKSLGLHLAKDGNVFHLQVSHNGYAHFGEVRVGAGYGRLFGKHFSISLTAIYLCQHAEHYQGRHSFTVNLSACCLIGSRWGLSVGLFNPILMRYGISGPEVIPLTFSLQAHHQWSDRLLVFLRVEKTLPGGADVAGGLSYRPVAHLHLTGTCSLRHLGLEVDVPWRHLLIRIRTGWYYRVNFSHAAAVQYFFKI